MFRFGAIINPTLMVENKTITVSIGNDKWKWDDFLMTYERNALKYCVYNYIEKWWLDSQISREIQDYIFFKYHKERILESYAIVTRLVFLFKYKLRPFYMMYSVDLQRRTKKKTDDSQSLITKTHIIMRLTNVSLKKATSHEKMRPKQQRLKKKSKKERKTQQQKTIKT